MMIMSILSICADIPAVPRVPATLCHGFARTRLCIYRMPVYEIKRGHLNMFKSKAGLIARLVTS